MTLDFILDFDFGLNQLVRPDKIRFTTSKNDQTSTLTLTFYNISSFLQYTNNGVKNKLIKSISFTEQDYKFSTKDIKIIWLKGRPYLLEAIFLITSEVESFALKKIFNSIYNSKKSFSFSILK
jgi:hypothetical protein